MTPWLKDFLVYDPVPVLKRVRCPVLSIIGTKDRQVSAKENNPALREALAASGHSDFTVIELRGLNHLLQSARTGSPAEYEHLHETIAPRAIENVSGWILKKVQEQTTRRSAT
jgi:fermentation-respiration switch protein FrsA (DUF1100 family)